MGPEILQAAHVPKYVGEQDNPACPPWYAGRGEPEGQHKTGDNGKRWRPALSTDDYSGEDDDDDTEFQTTGPPPAKYRTVPNNRRQARQNMLNRPGDITAKNTYQRQHKADSKKA
ncbi:hypothetical protein Bbelb_411360 [Branchiostoma belcheri]|nr:hypothetical protein Bbelb_411360 [Branchiostoma belcheri]